jgi:hypothetical protein
MGHTHSSWTYSIGLLVLTAGCSGTTDNSLTPEDSALAASDAPAPAAVALLRTHVEALTKGLWIGSSKFVYEDQTQPDLQADELLNVDSLEPNHFVYDGHSITGGFDARSFLEMAFENGSVAAVAPEGTLEPQIWTLTVLRASAFEVSYELDIKIPTISSHTREVVFERLAPDKKTLTRQTKLYFEEAFIGTRDATYTWMPVARP